VLSLVSLRERAPVLAPHALAAGLAAWGLGALISFRFVIASSFDVIFGDRGDARLIIYLHEHLYRALVGRADFLSPPMFYPQKYVLGFSDAFLLDTPSYAVLRAIGLDPFLSFQIWAMVLSLCCFLASLVICVRYIGLRAIFAICAAALITFPNNLMSKTDAGHLQFFAVYYVPPIVLLALWGIEDFPRVTPRSLARVAMAAALFAMLFATGYYTAWLFAFTLLIALCVVGVLLRRNLMAAAKEYYKPAGRLVGAAVVGFGVGLVPLVLIYAPALSAFSGRSFSEYLYFAPYPKDVIDVGTGNMVWGWLVGSLLGDAGVERTLAVAPGMTAIFLLMAYRLRKNATGPDRGVWQPIFFIDCAAVWLLSWLLTAKIGTVSLYWLPYHLVPGATAIRVGERIQLLANFWVVAGLAVLLQYWIDAARVTDRRRRIWLAGAILIFCLIEQMNTLPVRTLSRSRELAWLAAVPPPPAECGAFLVNARTQTRNLLDDDDALWLSWRTGLPTLNGVSGWTPSGWRLDDKNVNYFDAALRWIALTGMNEEVCTFGGDDVATWSKLR
jgi:hypothetical protein